MLLLTALGLAPVPPAHACSCAGGLSSQERLAKSAAVFQGTVTEVSSTVQKGETGPLRQYSFQVHTAWKGVNEKSVSLYSYDGDSAACGYAFSRGKTYLVYAYHGEDGSLQTNLCSMNQEGGASAEDLAGLGPGKVISAPDEAAEPPPSSGQTHSSSITTFLWAPTLLTAAAVLGLGAAAALLIVRLRSRR